MTRRYLNWIKTGTTLIAKGKKGGAEGFVRTGKKKETTRLTNILEGEKCQ